MKMSSLLPVISLSCFLITSQAAISSKIVYVGAGGCDDDDPSCYEPDGTNFISTCLLGSDGSLEVLNKTSGIRNPAWLFQHPDLDMLYASETGGSSIWSLTIESTKSNYCDKKSTEDISLLMFDESKCDMRNSIPMLTLGVSVVTGDAPVYISIDVTHKFLFVANYNGGSLSAVSLSDDGQVSSLVSQVQHYGHGVNPVRQEAPHVHGVFVTPYGNNNMSMVYAMDLGLDRIFWYLFDPSTGQLTNGTGGGDSGNDNFIYASILGSGPRHMAMTTTNNGKSIAHVIYEMGNSIESFEVNSENGALVASISLVHTLPFGDEDDFNDIDSKAAEILTSNDGTLIYASNRGDAVGSNSVVIFQVDLLTGILSEMPLQSIPCGGTFPRGMVLMNVNREDSGNNLKLVVGGQDSDSVSVFSVSSDDGLVNTTPDYTLTHIITPVTFA